MFTNRFEGYNKQRKQMQLQKEKEEIRTA